MKKFYIEFKDLHEEGLNLLYEIAHDIDIFEADDDYLLDASTRQRIVKGRDKISFFAASETELALRLKYQEDMHALS